MKTTPCHFLYRRERIIIVYVYTFPNGKKYVGQTIQSLEQRAKQGLGYHSYQSVRSAIDKYGWDNIQKEIYECNSEKEMDALEQELIEKFQTMNPEYGYNLVSGGHTNRHFSQETLAKMSAAQTGEKNHNFGEHLSDETKQKMSEAHKGKSLSEEHRKNLSLSHIGNRHSEETKAKMREHSARAKAVVCLETGKIYPSGQIAAEAVGLKTGTSIRQVCSKDPNRKTAGGYHWVYLKDYEKGE